MDTNRSEEQEEASYSDDFEHDMESQDSPLSEEKAEIKVYKSAVGSLTVQPKKVSKHDLMISDDNNKSARTLSELSLMKMKNKRPPATAGGGFKKFGSNHAGLNVSSRSLAVKANQRSKTSLNATDQPLNSRRPLAQEKVDPHDIPASVAASISSVSISRLSLRNRTATATGYPRGPPSNIRRVIAHTSIKEKSYASAKFKTYQSPPLLRGGNLPPLKAGLAKPNTNIAQRVASAKRMTIMDLKSKIKLLQDEIEKLKKENRFLNHLHHRQDNALRKWEGKDAELPKLLNQHKDEIRSLQEQLRRAQQHAREYNEKLSIRDKKILRLETELEKLKALVHEEHLQDRHTLQQDLDITRMNLIGAEKRIREYMRHVEILEKNHKHQLAAQERKLIKVNTHTYELQQVVANLKLALRNKDRMLNYIQMRSSGRTLIRAFHAERLDRGDDMLYGPSIQTELNRPYQPPALPPLIKSHSFDFGNSRCSTPLLDDNMRDYEIFASNRRLSDERQRVDKKSRSLHRERQRHIHGESNGQKKSPRQDSRLSHSLESVGRTRTASPKDKKGNSHSVAPCSIKSHGRKETQFNSKSDSKVRNIFANNRKSPRSFKNVQHKSTKEAGDGSSGKGQHEMTLGDRNHISGVAKSSRKSPSNNNSSKCHDKQISNERWHPLNNAESKELIYHGSTQGFKYEGPFVNSNSNLDCKKDSTEILYSPKSDKLSERSLSSTCTSHTVTSSRSEEIISNIDILSARIRESCVLVPPPEENFKSPRRHENSIRETETVAQSSKTQHNSNPPIGPAGDNTNSPQQYNQAVLVGPTGTSHALPHKSKLSPYQGRILQQPVQLISHKEAEEESMSSPKSNQSVASPRVQLQSMSLPSVAATMSPQSGQLQLTQPVAMRQPNYVAQLTGQLLNSPATQHLSFMTANQSQGIENNGIQYTSPRVNHGYTTAQSVNAMPEPIAFQQDSQQSVPVSSRLSPELFSFATNSSIQEGMSPTGSVTIFQANPQYGLQQQAFASPRATGLTNGPFHNQQPVLIAPSARNAFPRMGFMNSSQVGNSGGEQLLPTINGNAGNKSQSVYNPSYYVNLGSWK